VKSLDLNARLALRPAEAARALGLSERSLRQMLAQIPHLRAGSAVLIPVDSLRDWLRERAQVHQQQTNATVREIVESLDDLNND